MENKRYIIAIGRDSDIETTIVMTYLDRVFTVVASRSRKWVRPDFVTWDTDGAWYEFSDVLPRWVP